MESLAHWHDGGGLGPWALLFPLVWVAAFAGAFLLLRSTAWRGRGPRGPWQRHVAYGGRGGRPGRAAHGPLDLLDHRFARGEIDEDEYWRRYAVLNESAHGRNSGTEDGAP